MVISHSHSFIFVHVPKTGGTSVMKALLPFADGQDIVGAAGTKHEAPSDLFGRQPDARLRNYFCFAFVRNPWRRFASFHTYLKGRPDAFPWITRMPDLHAFASAVRNGDEDVRGRHSLRPQLEFLVDGDGLPALDYIGRQETIERDFAAIARRIGVEPPALPRTNRSRYVELPTFDAEVDDFVREWFAADVEALGYSGPDDDSPAPIEMLRKQSE